MATKKKRSRPPAKRAAATPSAGGGANPERRERKEEARRAREAERKRDARRAAFRRALIFGAAGLVLLLVLWLIQRAPGARPIPADAVAAASAAGCSGVSKQFDHPSRAHLTAGEDPGYTEHPTTAGPHNPSPLPDQPKVLTSPVDETMAVHSLEHAAVIVYYNVDNGLGQPVVDRLTQLVPTLQNTFLIPYPTLPAKEGLALAAWNQLQTCPPNLTPTHAATIVTGFSTAFACTSNAPEPKSSGGC